MTREVARDSGMGLVELIIYIALTLVILSSLGGVVISMVSVQNQVMNSANTAEQAQLVSRSIHFGVGNSSAVDLQSVNGTDQLLRVRSSSLTSSTVWSCQAWYFSPSEKSMRFKSSSSAIAAPSAADLANWTLLASGVSTAQGQQVFTLSGSRVSLVFAQQLTTEAPIVIKTSASARAGVRVSAPCF
jgi:hypothetical protein